MAGKINPRALTKYLHQIGAEICTNHFGDEGGPITNEEALARLVWKHALGWTEETRDDSGNMKQKAHAPASWAMQYVFERREGKSTPAVQDQATGMKTAEKVRELAKQRLNSLAAAATKKVKPAGPPSYRPK